jgi:hypothetical protein
VTGDSSRFHDGPIRVARADQRPVGHDKVHLDRLKHRRLATGECRQGGVGSDGSQASALVTFVGTVPADHGTSARLECGLGPGHLDHRPEDRQVRHAIGGAPNADPTRADRRLHPAHHRCGVDLRSDPAGGPVCLGQPEPSQQGADPAVDFGTVLVREPRCRLCHRRRVPLRALPRRERRHGRRKVGQQSPAQADEAVTESR